MEQVGCDASITRDGMQAIVVRIVSRKYFCLQFSCFCGYIQSVPCVIKK